MTSPPDEPRDGRSAAEAARDRAGGPFAAPSDAGEAARLLDFRTDTFGEMSRAATRWQAIAIVPFQIFVLGVLVAYRESTIHLVLQGVVLAACIAAASSRPKALADSSARARASRPSFFAVRIGPLLGAATYFVSIANTGGLASPLLVTGIPMLMPMSAHPVLVAQRKAATVFFFVGFLVMGALSFTPVGLLEGHLQPHAGWSSHEYVLLATVSCLITTAGIAFMGSRFASLADGLSRELAARREELFHETEDRTRSLEGVAARLAHEVKNPLAAIKGLSTHMVRQSNDPKVQERLRIVAQEAERLQSIVDGFLSFSRGLDDIHPQKIHLTEVCEALVVLLELRAREFGVRLHVTETSAAVGSIVADPRKVRQALLNLLLNAIHASPFDSEVGIELAADGDFVEIAVIDRGSGMTPEVLERIKRPYFSTKDGGSGLGIAVARAQIEQHGGTLRYESVAQEEPVRSRPPASSLAEAFSDPASRRAETNASRETAGSLPKGTRAVVRLPRDASDAVRSLPSTPHFTPPPRPKAL
jgi:signal transduction histidine kinase